MKLYYKDDYCTVTQGDCLEVMVKMAEKGLKFDAIITDPPYGTTKCKWDSIVPLDKMWNCLKNIRKENSPIVLFGSEPFSSLLRCSNLDEFKYDWIWDKSKAANFPQVKYMPLKIHENISVFAEKKSNYFPVMATGTFRKKGGYDVKRDFAVSAGTPEKHNDQYYPKSILDFSTANNANSRLHPTQKSLDLMEYLIQTYTKEGDTILDFTCGSGTTLVAAKKLKRKCYGIELEEKYCEVTKNRLLETT